jgi:hypothetical protein
MRAAGPDRALDLGHIRRAAGRDGLGLRMPDIDAVHQFGHRLTDRRPVRRVVVAGAKERRAQPLQAPFVAQLRQTGAAQQRPQRRITQCGAIEFAEMRVAAAVAQQQGIADVVQRGPVLGRGQRAIGGAGDGVKSHEIRSALAVPHAPRQTATGQTSGRRRLFETCKCLKNYTNSGEIQM